MSDDLTLSADQRPEHTISAVLEPVVEHQRSAGASKGPCDRRRCTMIGVHATASES